MVIFMILKSMIIMLTFLVILIMTIMLTFVAILIIIIMIIFTTIIIMIMTTMVRLDMSRTALTSSQRLVLNGQTRWSSVTLELVR